MNQSSGFQSDDRQGALEGLHKIGEKMKKKKKKANKLIIIYYLLISDVIYLFSNHCN